MMIRKKLVSFVFISCSISTIGITSCQQEYSGSGDFVDNGLFSSSNRYEIYFDDFYIPQGNSTHYFSFSGTPDKYFGLNFHVYVKNLSLSKTSQEIIISNDNEVIHDILGVAKVEFSVDIIENGSRVVHVERSFLNKSNDHGSEWTYNPYSYDTIAYSHHNLAFKYLNKSTYKIKILVNSDMDLSDEIYVRPVMSAGEPWAL